MVKKMLCWLVVFCFMVQTGFGTIRIDFNRATVEELQKATGLTKEQGDELVKRRGDVSWTIDDLSKEAKRLSPDAFEKLLLGTYIVSPDDKRLGEGDILIITVEKQKKEFTVQSDGMIVLPTPLTPMAIKGMTVNEVAERFYRLYNIDDLTVELKKPAEGGQVVVIGAPEVLRPGLYKSGRLFDVVAEAGGIKYIGKASRVRVLRNSEWREFSLKKFRKGDVSQNPPLIANDVVEVRRGSVWGIIWAVEPYFRLITLPVSVTFSALGIGVRASQ
ncbi:MAG: polysaccharide biosynthesis/export family protein [Candidatus Edwardsbacteria bacterium]